MSTYQHQHRSSAWRGVTIGTVALLIALFAYQLLASPTITPATSEPPQQIPSQPLPISSEAGQILMALVILAKMYLDGQHGRKSTGDRVERDRSRDLLRVAQEKRQEVVEENLLALVREIQQMRRDMAEHDRKARPLAVDAIEKQLAALDLREDAQERRTLAMMDKLDLKDTEVRK